MDYNKKSLELHEKHNGKLGIVSKFKIENKDDLSIAYTPGVAAPCKEIEKNPEDVYKYTIKRNTIAVVTDGSAVLGLGNIGAEASIPVMEGKAVLLKKFADVDAFPICLKTQDVDEIVKIVENIEPVFGGINLEDISAPRCVEIERILNEKLNIPVFHDDQHGTAIVVLSALINALKVVKKDKKIVKTIINGAGAAGGAIAKMLHQYGFENIIMCDKQGILNKENTKDLWYQAKLTNFTNCKNLSGTLENAFKDADIFIGVSGPNLVSSDMIQSMNKDAIIFAMANPIPEIMPEEARRAGAKVVGSGRSDFVNQVNNVLAFPGIFRGALDAKATCINEEMKLAAAEAIASLIGDELDENHVIPSVLDDRVVKIVADAVYNAAVKSNVAR